MILSPSVTSFSANPPFSGKRSRRPSPRSPPPAPRQISKQSSSKTSAMVTAPHPSPHSLAPSRVPAPTAGSEFSSLLPPPARKPLLSPSPQPQAIPPRSHSPERAFHSPASS